jgi:hypothetical protein
VLIKVTLDRVMLEEVMLEEVMLEEVELTPQTWAIFVRRQRTVFRK